MAKTELEAKTLNGSKTQLFNEFDTCWQDRWRLDDQLLYDGDVTT